MRVSFIGSVTNRTYFYLKAIKDNSIKLDSVLLYDYKVFDNSNIRKKKLRYKDFLFEANESFEKLLDEFNVKIYDKSSINDLKNELEKEEVDFFIFSGKSAEIVKSDILKRGKFLHIHPGKLPEYKGSTTIYYSILNENKLFATAFFLAKKIDSGDIIKDMEFELHDCDIDNFYDPFIRTYLLIDVLKSKEIELKKQKDKNKEYYIIHPVLKNIAIKRCKDEKNI